jgi:hypothetical protein
MTKRKTKKKLSWLKNPKNRPQVVLIVLVILGGGYFAYQSYAKWQDKHKFEQAQASINELYSEIVTKVGQPGISRSKYSCRYASLKYSRGPLSCGFESQFAYRVDRGGVQANIVVTAANEIVSKDLNFINYKVGAISDLPFKPFSEFTGVQSTSLTFIEKKTSLACSLKFNYFPYSDGDVSQFVTSASGKVNLSAQIGCGGYSKGKYYQLES